MRFRNHYKIRFHIRTGFPNRYQTSQVGINLRLWCRCTLYFDYVSRDEVSVAVFLLAFFINDQIGSRSFREDRRANISMNQVAVLHFAMETVFVGKICMDQVAKFCDESRLRQRVVSV